MNFIKNLSSYFLANLFTKVISFFLFTYVSNILTPEDYGILAIVNSIVGNSSSVIFLGLGAVVLTHYIHEKNKIKLLNDLNNIFYRSYSLFICVMIFCFLFINFQFIDNFTTKIIIFLYIIISVFLSFYADVSINILRMENKINYIIKIILFTTIINALVVIVCLQFIQSFIVLFISSLVANILFFIYIFKNHFGMFKFRKKDIFKKDILQVSIPFMLGSVFNSLLLGTDKYMLNSILDLKTVGIYDVSLKFGSLYDVIIATVFTSIYMPWLLRKLKLNFDKYMKLNIIIVYINLIIPFIILYLPDYFWELIGNFIGSDFESSIKFIKYMVINYIILHSITLLNIIFLYLKQSKMIAITVFIMFILNIILNYFMINSYGLIGSIISSYICMLIAILYITFIQIKNQNEYLVLSRTF